MPEPFRCISSIAMLGYGIPPDSLERGLERRPHLIGADAGSTDAGPHKLGRGVADISREATARDLRLMLQAGRRAQAPVVIGSCGGSGADVHLDWTWDILRAITSEDRLPLRVAVIRAEVAPAVVRSRLAAGQIARLGAAPPLTPEAVNRTPRIVAQMGAEPIMRALDKEVDLVLAGRACDAAIFAAPAIRAGADPGLAWHMGEILECGAMCAEPGSANDCMLGTVEEARFVLEPLNPKRRCTPASVACHSLYERSHPYLSHGPGHELDLSGCRFSALDDRRVAVSGSRYRPIRPTRIKLEGATSVGFRTIVVGGIRDPIAIERLDETIEAVSSATHAFYSDLDPSEYSLRTIVYGRDGVMGALEPRAKDTGHEVGIVLDVVAISQELANAVCAFARSQFQHYHYQGIKSTAANIAFPMAPSDIPCGEIFEFSIYHLMEVADPCEAFPIEIRTLGA